MRGRRLFGAVFSALLLIGTLVAIAASPAGADFLGNPGEGNHAIVRDAGCTQNTLSANDDLSAPAFALPSTFNFFGQTFGSVYPNNNGNVTFDGPLSQFTPDPISGANKFIIAPFWADVDTRGQFSGLLNYGNITFAGRPAVCLAWDLVGYFSSGSDKRNDFQTILVDRSDTGAGNFDIIFNYDQVQWEAGGASGGVGGLGGDAARAGYSNGTDTSLELPGSGVNGAFIDGGPNALATHSFNSLQLGRYYFPVRNGEAPSGGTVAGQVTDPANNGVVGAIVQACDSNGACHVTNTGANGNYSIPGLAPGAVHVSVNPPSGSGGLRPGSGNTTIINTETEIVNIALTGPQPLPGNTTVGGIGTTTDGVPILYWTQSAPFTTHNCVDGVGGTVTTTFADPNFTPVITGLTENPPHSGTYTGTLPAFYPSHGDATVTFHFNCPGGAVEVSFTIYIDPSGTVVDQHSNPVAGATVTLFRSDSSTGPFDAVPDGSAVMSPANRANPDTTDEDGHFGWDVVAGFYKVSATAPSCDSQTTDVLTIPPPVTNLQIQLNCSEVTGTPSIAVGDRSIVEGLKGTQKMLFPVTLDAPANSDVTVQYSVGATGGDTATAGTDFKATTKNGTIKFKKNKKSGVTPTRAFITVPVYGDAVVEGNETFHVTLSNLTGPVDPGDLSALGTIIDDDDPASAASISDGSVVEPSGGKGTTVKVTIFLATPATQTETVMVSHTGGSATPGSDYEDFHPTLITFKAKQYKQTIEFKVFPDKEVESPESIELTLSSPTGGMTLGRNPGIFTIYDRK